MWAREWRSEDSSVGSLPSIHLRLGPRVELGEPAEFRGVLGHSPAFVVFVVVAFKGDNIDVLSLSACPSVFPGRSGSRSVDRTSLRDSPIFTS